MPEFLPDLQQKISDTLGILQRSVIEDTPVTFASSLGAEDMVLTDLVYRHVPEIRDFTLDTGRLPEETYTLLQKIRSHYGRAPRIYFPKADSVEEYVAENGPNGFYSSIKLRKRCCAIRKVDPLRRALNGHGAWITGLRREQSVTRHGLGVREWDEVNGLYKISPLADWSDGDIWAYIHAHGVPYNLLHDQNFPSIGCAPCTRAINPGEDIRAGRWWWELAETRECGLHWPPSPGEQL